MQGTPSHLMRPKSVSKRQTIEYDEKIRFVESLSTFGAAALLV